MSLRGSSSRAFEWRCNTWCGLAFERTCLWHIEQIKKKLGISGVLTEEYAWRCQPDEKSGTPGAQIDLLIDRADGIIDLCEMKYSDAEFAITERGGEVSMDDLFE